MRKVIFMSTQSVGSTSDSPPETSLNPGDGSPPTKSARADREWTRLGTMEKVAAVALIVAFLLFVVGLVAMRDDRNWDRLVYLFTGLETLVFAASGALFGTVVQREQTQQARQTAEQERTRADANETDALHGRALAAMVRAVDRANGEGSGDGGAEREGRAARPGPSAPARPMTGMAELAAVAEEWFPSGRR
jgi:hypothetical protein